MAEFENCSEYYSWGLRERLCHLRASLDKDVGQVLWDAGQQSSVENLIALLRNRYGSANHVKDIVPNKGAASSTDAVYP